MAQQEVVGCCSSLLTPLLLLHPEAEGGRVVLHPQMAPLELSLEQGMSELGSQPQQLFWRSHTCQPAPCRAGGREFMQTSL